MNTEDRYGRWDRIREERADPSNDPRERTVAPPIEREHETQADIFEADERRERERERERERR